MALQLNPKNITFPEETDTVVVSRINDNAGTIRTKTQVFSGACNLQEGSGSFAFNASATGVVMADARCLIDGTPNIQVGDECVFNGNASQQTYIVVANNQWSMYPIHMELYLKAGPLNYKGRT